LEKELLDLMKHMRKGSIFFAKTLSIQSAIEIEMLRK